jgi:uncharacterized protein YuzE
MASVTRLGSVGSSQNVRRVDVLAILDVGADGEVLGIEVLQASRCFGQPLRGAGPAFTSLQQDPVADALYVRVREATVRPGTVLPGQEVRQAAFFVDPDGVLLAVEIEPV